MCKWKAVEESSNNSLRQSWEERVGVGNNWWKTEEEEAAGEREVVAMGMQAGKGFHKKNTLCKRSGIWIGV